MTGCLSADGPRLQNCEEVIEEQTVEAEEEKEVPLGKKGRGEGFHFATSVEHNNFLLMWGCRPSSQVEIETKMVKNIIDTLMRFDKVDLSIQLPLAFEHLKGSDAQFEMVTSNMI